MGVNIFKIYSQGVQGGDVRFTKLKMLVRLLASEKKTIHYHKQLQFINKNKDF